jgi:tRNA threonylcarbamoyladenosine biosynthesis protein TsaB
MILAIDTATQYAGLALYNPDGLQAEESWYTGRNHTVELAPRLARMLKSARLNVSDLSALAVSIGPGSFTGLRIGLAVAKGLALPHKLPVIGIPTLEITAYPFRKQPLPIWAIAQAGRSRILAACYSPKEDDLQQLVEPFITTVEALAQRIDQPVLCAGEIDVQAAKTLRQNSHAKAHIASPADRLRRPGYLAEIAVRRLEDNAQDDPDALVPLYVSTL